MLDMPSAPNAEARLGYQSAYQRYSPVIGDTVIYPVQSGRIGVSRFHYNLNLTDDPVLPCVVCPQPSVENGGMRTPEPTNRFR